MSEDSPILNDPATRLHAILSRAVAGVDGTPTIQVWEEALDVPSHNLPLLLSRLVLLLNLPPEIESIVREDRNVDHDLYLRWRGPVGRALDVRALHSPWANYKKYLSPDVMTGLEFCAHYLARKRPEPALSSRTVSDLWEQATELRSTVEKADISFATKKYLLDLLVDFLAALDSVPLTGIRGLENQLNTSIGRFMTERSDFADAEKSNIGKKVFAFFATVALILSAANDGWELYEKGLPHLTPYLEKAKAKQSTDKDSANDPTAENDKQKNGSPR